MVPHGEGVRIQRHREQRFQAWYPLMGPPASKTFRWGTDAEFDSEADALAEAIAWLNTRHDLWLKRQKK